MTRAAMTNMTVQAAAKSSSYGVQPCDVAQAESDVKKL